MAATADTLLAYAREKGISTDHISYSRESLNDLSSYMFRQVTDYEHEEPFSTQEQLVCTREGLKTLHGLCNVKLTASESTGEHLSKFPRIIDIPLLSTNHEDDLCRHTNSLQRTRHKYIEQPPTIDIAALDARITAQHTTKLAGDGYIQGIGRVSMIIPKVSRQIMQDLLMSTKPESIKENQLALVVQPCIPEHLQSPLVPCEEASEPLVDLDNIPSLNLDNVVVVSHDIKQTCEFDLKEDLSFDQDLVQRLDLLHDVKTNLMNKIPTTPERVNDQTPQSDVARFHLWSEAKASNNQESNATKIQSPLTPPNSTHRHQGIDITGVANSLEQVHSKPPKHDPITPAAGHGSQDQTDRSRVTQHNNRHVFHEQIVPRQFIRKLKLPTLPSIISWSEQPGQWSATNKQAFRIELQDLMRQYSRPTIDIRTMKWSPWWPYGFQPEEFEKRFSLVIDTNFKGFLGEATSIDSRDLVYLPQKASDDIEVLEPAETPDVSDMTFLLNSAKRRLPIQSKPSIRQLYNNSVQQAPAIGKRKTYRDNVPVKLSEESFPGLGFDLLAKKKTRLEHSKAVDAPTPKHRPLQDRITEKELPLPVTIAPRMAPRPMTAPESLQLVVSSSGTLSRVILRRLLGLLPQLHHIERDFMPSQPNNGVPTDADIALSATVGIIVTTSTELQQRPLPGDHSLPRIQNKVQSIASKYEKIFVLAKANGASQATSEDLPPSLLQDAQLEQEWYISEDEIAKRVASLCIEHACQKEVVELIEEEYLLEEWLRREAGLTCIAAQVVLQRLSTGTNITMNGILQELYSLQTSGQLGILATVIGTKNLHGLDEMINRYMEDIGDMDLQAKEMYDLDMS